MAVDWRETTKVLVPVNETAAIRLIRYQFKLKDEDKLRVDPKHLAHHTLL